MEVLRNHQSIIAAGFLLTAFLASCSSELVPSPAASAITDSSSGISSRSISAPQNLTATQGGKRKITLAWSEVSKAVRYYIYAASNPFDTYIRVGETSALTYEYSADSGITRCFKVAALDYSGTQSDTSIVVSGTTLACPSISDIVLPENSEDSSASVYWYMENADAYAQSLIYVITCMNGSTVVKTATMAGAASDGTATDTSYTFTKLTQNTSYKYTVEAYLTTAQTDNETSNAVDYATAVSLKPKAPVSLSASEGTSLSQIQLTFKLPEEAYIKNSSSSGTSSSADTYSHYPVYFKIFRRISTDTEETKEPWITMTDGIYYSNDASAAGYLSKNVPANVDAYAYTEGSSVTWTDSSSIARGLKYEYKVQSFVFGKNTTSSSSFSTATGWTAAAPSLKLGTYSVTAGKTMNTSSVLSLTASWKSLGKEDAYCYIIKSSRAKAYSNDIDDSESYTLYNSVSAINNSVFSYKISDDSAANTSVRGYYTYTLFIVPKNTAAADSSAEANALDKVSAAGTILVTNELSLPSFSGFTVTSGYKDKVYVSWTNEADSSGTAYTYTLSRYVLDNNGNQDGDVTVLTADSSSTAVNQSYTFSDTGLASGKSYVYALYAATSTGLKVPSAPLTAETLGTPAPVFDETAASYDSVTASWKPVKQASSYAVTLNNGTDIVKDTVTAVTTDGITSYTVTKSDGTASEDTIDVNAEGSLVYTITKPSGYNNAAVSGSDMTFVVSASSTYSGTIRDTTTSPAAAVRTLGPAKSAVSATVAKYADRVEVKWNTLAGAKGYLVRRDRCTSSNSDIVSTDAYIVPANPSGTSGEIKANSETVTAVTASAASGIITLTDTYTAEPSSSVTTWQNNQDKLSWGYPYRYTVFPLEDAADTYDVSSSSTSIKDVTYTGTGSLYSTGSTIGYGVDVHATKSEDPRKVTITWTKPYLGTTSPDPKLYRTADGKNLWEPTSASIDSTGNFIVCPTGTERTTAYDYAVSYNGDKPHETYLSAMTSAADPLYSSEPKNKGYPFAVESSAVNVTTNGAASYSEKVSWKLWDYTARAAGPADGTTYTVNMKNSDYDTDWHKIADVSSKNQIKTNPDSLYQIIMTPSESGITVEPVFYNDTHSGLLQVLRDYRHYVQILVKRTNSAGNEIYASYADGNMYAYREITPKEFALASALSIATSMYTGIVTPASYDTDYNRRYTYSKTNTTLFSISGELLGGTSGVGQIPFIYGGYRKVALFIPTGTPTTDCTLSFYSRYGEPVYNGSVVINGMKSDSGTYTVTYDGKTADYRSIASKPFTFGSFSYSDCSSLDWSATDNTWK